MFAPNVYVFQSHVNSSYFTPLVREKEPMVAHVQQMSQSIAAYLTQYGYT